MTRSPITRRSVIIGAGLGVAAVVAGVSPAPVHTLAVSTGKTDITPPAGHPMGGYATNAPRRATGVHHPLAARCTVLRDDGVPKAIVTADVLGFGRRMHDEIRRRVTPSLVADADFVLTATHTHNGPALIEKPDPYAAYALRADDLDLTTYSDWLVDAVVHLVETTLAAPQTPCTLDYRLLAQGFSHNREGLAHDERDVPVVVARALDGTPRAVLFGYAAHPVAADLRTQWDPDYPATAIERIEEVAEGTFAQFLLGPAGDQDPRVVTGGFARVRSYGDDLGAAVADAIRTPGRPLTGPIRTARSTVSLPLDVPPGASGRKELRDAYAARTGRPRGYERRHALEMVRLLDRGIEETAVPLPLQRWTFGGGEGLDLLFSGGELVSGYAVELRRRHGGSQRLWVAAYANEVPAYIPNGRLLARSTYAGGWTDDDPSLAALSMSVYGCMGHFRSAGGATGPEGVEDILMRAFDALL